MKIYTRIKYKDNGEFLSTELYINKSGELFKATINKSNLSVTLFNLSDNTTTIPYICNNIRSCKRYIRSTFIDIGINISTEIRSK